MEEENLFKENIEKSKQELRNHLKTKKVERKYREMLDILDIHPMPHIYSEIDLKINNEELDNDFEKSKKDLYDKLIWEDNTKEEK